MRRIRTLSRTRRLVLALVVGGAVFAVATAVQASIPDASGVIHSCYKTNTGSLRVIDSPGSACGSSEKPLNWSQRGPTGPTGPAGPSFGDGKFSEAIVGLITCAGNEVLTLPLTVSKPSRIFGIGAAYFDPNGSAAEDAIVNVQLRDASDTTTLAETGAAGESVDAPANGTAYLDAANVLLTAPDGTSVYTAQPGTFVLRLEVNPAGNCTAVGSFVAGEHLSYLLLGTTP